MKAKHKRLVEPWNEARYKEHHQDGWTEETDYWLLLNHDEVKALSNGEVPEYARERAQSILRWWHALKEAS